MGSSSRRGVIRAALCASVALAALTGALVAPVAAAQPVPARTVPVSDVVRTAAVEWGCTVTARGTVPSPNSTSPGGPRVPAVLTAGHCFGSVARGQARVGSPVWGPWAYLSPVGRLAASSVPKTLTSTNRTDDPDYAVVVLDPGVGTAGPAAPLGAAPAPGAAICKQGRVTARTCGRVVSASADGGFFVARVDGFYGDSGSPAYDSAGRLVGMLSRIDAKLLRERGMGVPFLPGRSYVVFESIDRIGVAAYESVGFLPDGYHRPAALG